MPPALVEVSQVSGPLRFAGAVFSFQLTTIHTSAPPSPKKNAKARRNASFSTRMLFHVRHVARDKERCRWPMLADVWMSFPAPRDNPACLSAIPWLFGSPVPRSAGRPGRTPGMDVRSRSPSLGRRCSPGVVYFCPGLERRARPRLAGRDPGTTPQETG